MHFYSAPVENELKTSGLQHSKKKKKIKIQNTLKILQIWKMGGL